MRHFGNHENLGPKTRFGDVKFGQPPGRSTGPIGLINPLEITHQPNRIPGENKDFQVVVSNILYFHTYLFGADSNFD